MTGKTSNYGKHVAVASREKTYSFAPQEVGVSRDSMTGHSKVETTDNPPIAITQCYLVLDMTYILVEQVLMGNLMQDDHYIRLRSRNQVDIRKGIILLATGNMILEGRLLIVTHKDRKIGNKCPRVKLERSFLIGNTTNLWHNDRLRTLQ